MLNTKRSPLIGGKMPELPEVETTKNGISPYLKGFTIERIVVRQPKLRWPVSSELMQISQQKVSAKDQQTIDELFSTANDIERIGDHAENIADFAKSIIEREIFLDEE